MNSVLEINRANTEMDRTKRVSRLPSLRPRKRLLSNLVKEQREASITELSRLLVEGEELLSMGAYESATERFSECLARAPYLAVAAEGLAEACDRLGRHGRAAEMEPSGRDNPCHFAPAVSARGSEYLTSEDSKEQP